MTLVMDKSNNSRSGASGLKTIYSENFRTPSAVERRTGLWVDRIGSGVQRTNDARFKQLRYLGLFSTVTVERAPGKYVSRETGELAVIPGDVIVVFPEVACDYYPLESWESKWVSWTGSQPHALMPLYFNPRTPIIHGAADVVADAYRNLLPLMQREDTEVLLKRIRVIIDLMEALARRGSVRRAATSDPMIEDAIGFIQDNFREDLNVAELARSLHISETHFRRLFKTYTGRSPKDFLISERITNVKGLLLRGMPMKEACRDVGYDDVFYFMRIFKKVTGMSVGNFLDGRSMK